MLLTSISLGIVLLTFHILAVFSFIDYFDDVASGEDSGLPTLHVVVSFSAIGSSFLISIGICIYKQNFDTSLTILIVFNIVYIGCYFMPYMLLAFIYNPLQTFVVYFIIAVCVVYMYLYILSVWIIFLPILKIMSELIKAYALCESTSPDFRMALHYTSMLHASTIACTFLTPIMYFIIVIVLTLSLGSFSDFAGFQSLLPPLVTGLIGYFIATKTSLQVC